MHYLVFDIETKNAFADVGGDLLGLDISLVGVYDSKTDKYSSYLQEDFEELWPLIESVDTLIGYNSDHFDIPLLNKYYLGDISQIRSLDLMVEIQKAVGKRLKLDQIAEATLGANKSGHGLQAVTWWKQGKIEEIRKYCIDDVRITKEVYDYALKHGELKYKLAGEHYPIKIDTSEWVQSGDHAMTQSLF